jgi:hypothetical protein
VTFEAKPHTGPLERVVSQLSIKGAEVGREGGGGVPELTPSDYAAMTAGLSDPVARELIGVICEDAGSVTQAVRELDGWGWMRFRIDFPDRRITGKVHGLLAVAAVAEYQAGSAYPIDEICRFLKMDRRQFLPLAPHFSSLNRRLLEAEQRIVGHISAQLRD